MLGLLALICYGLAAIFALIGYIGFLFAAFGEGILWGVLCLFFWPVQLLFAVTHWDKARRPLFAQLLGIGFGAVAAVLASRGHR